MAAIPILLIISFIFYTIAAVDGKIFGTPEDEIDEMINSKLKDLLGDTTSGKSYEEDAALIKQKNSLENLSNVQFALKLIPSMDQQSFILQRMSLVGGYETGYSGLESDVEYDEEAIGDYSEYPQFFEWNGAKHLSFPSLTIDTDHVPLGDSMLMCLGLSWSPIKKRNQYDRYLDIRGFSYCQSYLSGHVFWEKSFPKKGLTFKLWEQDKAQGDSYCTGGIYQQSIDMCFRYKVMEQVCVLVKLKKDTETNSYSWVYTGGCYKDGDSVWYVNAQPNEKYDFKNVQFEVRIDQRDWSEINVKEEDTESEEQKASYDETAEDENNEDGEEFDAAKKKEEQRQEYYKQAANGEIKAEGHYPFYKLFRYIAGFALFAAVVCVGVLIFLFVSMMKGSQSDVERRPLVNG